MNIALVLLCVVLTYLKISLNPSATTCKKPHTPTTVGPCLLCKPAKIFLSVMVNKATAISAGNNEDIPNKINFKLININKLLTNKEMNTILKFYSIIKNQLKAPRNHSYRNPSPKIIKNMNTTHKLKSSTYAPLTTQGTSKIISTSKITKSNATI